MERYTPLHTQRCVKHVCVTLQENDFIPCSRVAPECRNICNMWLKCGQWSEHQEQCHSLWLPSRLINHTNEHVSFSLCTKTKTPLQIPHLRPLSLIDHPQSCWSQVPLQTHRFCLMSSRQDGSPESDQSVVLLLEQPSWNSHVFFLIITLIFCICFLPE